MRRIALTLEHLEARVTPTISFGSPFGYAIGGNTRTAAVGDLNNDGLNDFVASDVSAGTVPFLNNGNGTFTQMPAVAISDPRSTALVDMDGDGKRDIVVAAGMALVMVIARGKGDGTFENPFNRPVGSGPQSAVIADFNGDGKPDVAIASSGLIVMMNDGSANILGSPTPYNTGTDAYNLTAGDFNGDGKPDIALSGYSTNRVDVVLNNGSGGFGAVVSYPFSWHGGGITAGDLNHDGRDDLMETIVNGALNVMLANPSGTFQSPVPYSPPIGAPGQMGIADFNGDGNLDVAANCGDITRVAVFPGDGTGALQPAVMAVAGALLSPGLAVGDVTGDGLPDLITTASTSPGGVGVTPNTTTPSIASFLVTAVSTSVAGQGFDVTVTARDSSNATLTTFAGTVSFTSNDPLATAGNGLPANYTFVAGDNGVHTFTNVVLKTAGARTVTVTATATPTATGTANFTVTAAAAATITVSSGNGQSVVVGTAFAPTVALVKDAFGNSVSGVTVTFAGPPTGAGVSFPGGATPATDATGKATATATANTTAGSYAVTATVGGVATPATFNLTNTAGSPATITVTGGNAQTGAVNQAFATSLSVRVDDTFGNPVPNMAVAFIGPPTGAGATFAGGGTTSTNASGTATVAATANTTAGAFGVVASMPGWVPTATFTLHSTAGAATTLAIVSGNNQSAIVGQDYAAPLVVRATDSFGNPVPGVQIGLSIPLDGPTVSLPSGTSFVTATDGTASVTLGRAFLAGTVGIAVIASGTPSLVTTAATLTNIAAPVPRPELIGTKEFGVGTGAGQDSFVRFFRQDQSQLFQATAFPGFTGGVRTAAADFNGDGVADLVVGTGAGMPTLVRILSGKDGTELFRTAPFEAAFTGGVYVAAGDLTGDGKPDLVITPDEGGGPRVMVFSGNGFTQIANFFGIDDANFRGGVRPAIGDINGDGVGDLVVAAGFGGGPRVAVFDGTTVTGTPTKLFNDFFVFEQSLRNGSFVAAGDLDGDGRADLIAGGGPGGGPRVLAFNGMDLVNGRADQARTLANLFAGNPDNRGGVRVAVKNLDNDSKADIVVGDGEKAGSRVTAYLGATLASGSTTPVFGFDAFANFTGGVFVG